MAQKILYLVSEDWYFVSHRLPMARAARAAGFEVYVATRIAGHAAAIEREYSSCIRSAGVAAASIHGTCYRRCARSVVYIGGCGPTLSNTSLCCRALSDTRPRSSRAHCPPPPQ